MSTEARCSSTPEAGPEGERPQKRPRAAQACDTCRSRKVKCDGQYPCAQCQKSGGKCNFKGGQNAPWLGKASISYVQNLEKKVQELSAAAGQPDYKQNSYATLGLSDVPTAAIPSGGYQATIDSLGSPQTRSYTTQNYGLDPATRGSQNGVGIRYSPAEEDDDQSEDAPAEVSGVNEHTKRVEFHGKSSSMAVLEQLQKSRRILTDTTEAQDAEPSLVSTFHNIAFSPQIATSPQPEDDAQSAQRNDRYWFRHAYLFLNGYFDNLHYIHPFLDKDEFFARAEDLWLQRGSNKDSSFKGLYFAIMSLGALVRTWSEGNIDGLSRFEWSRKLFDEANRYINETRFSTDIETVQCCFMLAKVCQNELNPHLAYMYLGVAIRTSLSAGLNRHVRAKGDEQYSAISKLWWALYSLEIEMSFALGRPDTLGMDQYHNRRLPPIDNTEMAIIPCMVRLARMVREVSLRIYYSKIPLREKLNIAFDLEKNLEDWSEHLPIGIRPKNVNGYDYSKLSDPKWARRQRLVLGIRIHNIRMLLFKPFLTTTTGLSHEDTVLFKQAEQWCVDSAGETIKVIYETFQAHTFFHSWWYNTTYIMFAASIILLSLSRGGIDDLNAPGYQYVNMASEILDVMSESMVAKKYAEILRHSLREAQNHATNLNKTAAQPIQSNMFVPQGSMLSPPQSEVPSESTYAPEGYMAFSNADLGSIPMQMYGDFLFGTMGAERLDEADWFLRDETIPNFGGFG